MEYIAAMACWPALICSCHLQWKCQRRTWTVLNLVDPNPIMLFVWMKKIWYGCGSVCSDLSIALKSQQTCAPAQPHTVCTLFQHMYQCCTANYC